MLRHFDELTDKELQAKLAEFKQLYEEERTIEIATLSKKFEVNLEER